MSPTVSVVIATYNYGRFLAGSLDSVIAQTFPDWEAIVIDDGSTDNTGDVIRPYLSDSRIRYHRTDNHGQPAAENAGIRLSHGRFLAFLDADDLWLPSKLEKQLPLFDAKPEVAVVYSRRMTIDPEGAVVPAATRIAAARQLFRGEILEQMFRTNFVTFSSSVVRRDVFDEIGLFDEQCRHASDYELWLRIALGFEFDYVDEPLVLYRTGHPNLTSRGDVQLLTALRIMARFVGELGGHTRLAPALVRRSYAETYLHLAQVYANKSRIMAMRWCARALARSPGYFEAWKELVKLFLPKAAICAARRVIRRPEEPFVT